MRTWLTLALWMLSIPSAFSATVRFVDATAGACTGNYSIANRNCTGTDGNSYATVAAGIAAINAAGDTLWIRAGTYQQTTVLRTWPTVGTTANRILVSAYLAETVTLSWSTYTGTAIHGLEFNGPTESFITIQNLILNGADKVQSLVRFPDGGGTNIHVLGNEILNSNRNGVSSTQHNIATNHRFAFNFVHHNGTDELDHGFYMSGQNNIIEYNRIEANKGACVQIWKQGGDANANNGTIVRYNACNGNQAHGLTPAVITLNHGQNIQAYGNVIWGNVGTAPALTCGTFIGNCQIFNNTAQHGATNVITTGTSSTSLSASIRNNIAFGSTGTVILDPNDIATETTNLTTNPGLVNAATGDMSLLATATAAINTGTVTATICPAPCSIGAHQVISVASKEIGAVSSTTLVINLSSRFVPVSPATGCTGWSVRYAAVAQTISSCARAPGADLQIRLTMAAAPATGATAVDVSYAQTGNTTDCAQFGRGRAAACSIHNQELFALTNSTVINNTAGAPTFAIAQSRFAFRSASVGQAELVMSPSREWLGDPSGATTGENTDISVISPGAFALRIKVTCNTADCPAQGYAVWWATAIGGTYAKVSEECTTDRVCMYTTFSLRGGATTRQLTTDEPTFVPGSIRITQSSDPIIDLTQDDETEIESILLVKDGLTTGDQMCFRMRNDAGEVMTYTVTPCVTVAPIQTVLR